MGTSSRKLQPLDHGTKGRSGRQIGLKSVLWPLGRATTLPLASYLLWRYVKYQDGRSLQKELKRIKQYKEVYDMLYVNFE